VEQTCPRRAASHLGIPRDFGSAPIVNSYSATSVPRCGKEVLVLKLRDDSPRPSLNTAPSACAGDARRASQSQWAVQGDHTVARSTCSSAREPLCAEARLSAITRAFDCRSAAPPIQTGTTSAGGSVREHWPGSNSTGDSATYVLSDWVYPSRSQREAQVAADDSGAPITAIRRKLAPADAMGRPPPTVTSSRRTLGWWLKFTELTRD